MGKYAFNIEKDEPLFIINKSINSLSIFVNVYSLLLIYLL